MNAFQRRVQAREDLEADIGGLQVRYALFSVIGKAYNSLMNPIADAGTCMLTVGSPPKDQGAFSMHALRGALGSAEELLPSHSYAVIGQ